MAHNGSVENCNIIPGQPSESVSNSTEHNMQITTFTEDVKDVTLHFQIIRLLRQVILLCSLSSLCCFFCYILSKEMGNGQLN